MGRHKITPADYWHRFCEYNSDDGLWHDIDIFDRGPCGDQSNREHGWQDRHRRPWSQGRSFHLATEYVCACGADVTPDHSHESTGRAADAARAPMPAPRAERDAWSYESCDRTLYLRSY